MSDRRRVRRSIFVALTALLAITALETGSYMLWRTVVKPADRENVSALCGERPDPPRRLPNTFWHHELNPDHPDYRGRVGTLGTIGRDFVLPKPAGEFRIVCLGDSTTEGVGVGPDETYPAILERLLAERSPEAAVRVINAGIGSHNSAFNLSYLAFRLIHLDPDVVVIKSSYNDYLPYVVPGMQLDYTHAFPEPFTVRGSRNPYWRAAAHSYFLKLWGRVLFADEIANPFPAFSGVVTPEEIRSMDFSANADRFDVYADNVRSMILLAKGRGIGVLVLDLPTSPDPRHYGRFGEGFRALVSRLEQAARRVAAEENVPFIVTAPLDAADFLDHCHNTAAGNEKIARRVAAALDGAANL